MNNIIKESETTLRSALIKYIEKSGITLIDFEKVDIQELIQMAGILNSIEKDHQLCVESFNKGICYIGHPVRTRKHFVQKGRYSKIFKDK